MANALYPLGKKKLLDGDIDLLVDDIRCALIDTGVETYNSADEWHSNLTSPVADSGNLANKTTTSGVFNADDIVITAVTGSTVEAVVLYKWTGASGTSPLIAWFDTATYTPTGVNVTVIWHASGIFAI